MNAEEFMEYVCNLHHPLDDDAVFAMANKAYAKLQDRLAVEQFFRTSKLWDLVTR